jgi:hypothetical protein
LWFGCGSWEGVGSEGKLGGVAEDEGNEERGAQYEEQFALHAGRREKGFLLPIARAQHKSFVTA